MPSPATDDRIAFVIDTEAHLDGIVAARSEVRGIGVDSERSAVQMAAASRSNAQATADQMSPMSKILAAKTQLIAVEEKGAKVAAATAATTVAGTKNLGMWAALHAEAAGHVGKHTLAVGQLERRLASETEHMLGVNKAAGLMGTSLLKFGIGTIETVGILAGIAAITAAYHLLTDEANKAAAADLARFRASQFEHLKTFTAGGIGGELSGLQKQRQELLDAQAKGGGWEEFINRKRQPGEGIVEDIKDLFNLSSATERSFAKLDELYAAAIVRAKELQRAERMRLVALHDQVEFQIKSNNLTLVGARATEGSLDQTARRRQQLITQAALEDAQIKQSFVHRDEQGHLVALTKEQTREMDKLLAQHRELTDIQLHELTQAEQLANAAYKRSVATMVAGAGGTFSDSNLVDRYNARLAEINAEADLDLKAGRDAVEVERKRQAEIRALRRETAKAAMDDARTISGVLLASGSKDVRAIGHAAESIRRVIIGAQAAHAAVESAIEGGKAIGSLAAMDFRGAALHGAAALELAKAAALGAQESLGGGRGASGGGGGAGSGGGSTFEPRSGTEGMGSLTLNLYSQNELGAEKIQEIKWKLERADILKRQGIPIPASTGLRVA